MRDILRLLRYIRPYVGRLAVALVSAALLSVCYIGLLSLIQPIFDIVFQQDAIGPAATGGKISFLGDARRVFDATARFVPALSTFAERLHEGRTGTALLAALLLVMLVGFKGLCSYTTSYLTRSVGLFAMRDLRCDLYTSVQRQSLAFFSRMTTGQLVSRVVGDIAWVQRTVSSDLAEVLRLSMMVFGQAAWLFYLNWRLTGFCLVLLPLIVLPVTQLGRRLRKTSRQSMERMGEMVGIMQEGIRGTRIVQAFGMENYEIGRFGRALNRVLRAEKKGARVTAMTAPIMETLGAVGAALLFAYAAQRITDGKLTPGEFMTFAIALFMVFSSLKQLARINNQLQQASSAAARVFEIIDSENVVGEKPGAIELPSFRQGITFSGVSFTYGDQPVLRGIDLEIQLGQVIAIVGSSGAGKTTLVNLLPRFYDATGGSLRIDGHDVRDVSLQSLRRQIGLVTQDVILFDGTVRENIAYGHEEIPLERVIEAARSAHAHDFISSMPRGYDTPLGEDGHRLSLGQRQRLSIARAILKDSPILILDEATSSLDAESEAEVQEALRNLIIGRTVFVIAHRLSTVRSADRIVVLDKGRIVEQGTHTELLNRKGIYARLHELQFRDESPVPRASIV